MSVCEIYDTDGRRVNAETSASKEKQELIRRLSKSGFVDTYYDDTEKLLCYRIEGSYTGKHSRGGREQSFYAVVQDSEAIDSLKNSLTSALNSKDWKWDSNSDYGDIDRNPVEDIRMFAGYPRGRDSASDQKEELIGDLLIDGESELAIGTLERDSALRLLALYSTTNAVIVVGKDIKDDIASMADLTIEYGHDSEFKVINKSTQRRLSQRESEKAEKVVNETLNKVESGLESLSQQTSAKAEMKILQEIQKGINKGDRTLSNNYPDVAHQIVSSVRNSHQNLDGKYDEELLNTVNSKIEEQIDTLLSATIDESVEDLSVAIDEEVKKLTPLESLNWTPTEIKEQLLVKSAPKVVKPSRWRMNIGSTTIRIPIPKFYLPDVFLGVFFGVFLTLVFILSSLVFS